MKSPSACPFSFQFVFFKKVEIPSVILLVSSSQFTVLVNAAKLLNAPFKIPDKESAISFMEILDTAPFKAFPSELPSLSQPVTPAPSSSDIRFTNPDRIFQEIINLFPSNSPRLVQLISSSAPINPSPIFLPINPKSIPPSPIS